MSGATFDVVIAGGGIVGCACAWECVRAGMRVAVIEAECIGGGATAAGMGHIVVMDDSDAQFGLTRYSRSLWHELAAELPPDCEFEQTGTLWIAADEGEMGEVRRKYSFYSSRGVSAGILDEAQLRAAEPYLRPDCAGALLVEHDAVVYPPCVAAFLLAKARQSGASITIGHRVVRIDDEGVRLDNGTVVSGGVLVNALGAQASKVTSQLAVAPRKGHLLITDRYPGFVKHQLVELGYLKSAHQTSADSVAFNVQPRKTGQVLVGSSRQFGSVDPTIDRDILARMLKRAVSYMPSLAGLSAIRVWTGFRAATPDKLPLIGPVSGYKRVFAATGHEGLGITTSLATARLLVDCVSGREGAIDLQPYLAARQIEAAHV